MMKSVMVMRARVMRTSRRRGGEGGGTRGRDARETKTKTTTTRDERRGPRGGGGTWTVGWALRDEEESMVSMTMTTGEDGEFWRRGDEGVRGARENPEDADTTSVRVMGPNRKGSLAKIVAALTNYGLDVHSSFTRTTSNGGTVDSVFYASRGHAAGRGDVRRRGRGFAAVGGESFR